MNPLANAPSIRRDDEPGSGAFTADPHLVILHRPASPVAERYRRVRLSLDQTAGDRRVQQLTVVTSAVPGEGKTTTAANLALAYSEDTKVRTLLVDADMRRPALSMRITPEARLGLADVLAGKVPLARALIAMTDSNLWMLPAGARTDKPLTLLQHQVLESLIAQLRERFDRIVLDTPPTVPFTDAAMMAGHADGAVLVVRAGMTTAPLIRKARESLSGANLVGIVLNDVAFTAQDRYYERYYSERPS